MHNIDNNNEFTTDVDTQICSHPHFIIRINPDYSKWGRMCSW